MLLLPSLSKSDALRSEGPSEEALWGSCAGELLAPEPGFYCECSWRMESGTYCCPWTDKCLWMSPFPWTSGCVAPAQVSLPHSRPLDNNHLRWGVDSGCFVQAFSFIFCFWFYLALVKLKKNDLLYSTLCVNMGRGEDVRRTVGSRGDQKEVHIPELELEAVVNCSKQFQGNRIL